MAGKTMLFNEMALFLHHVKHLSNSNFYEKKKKEYDLQIPLYPSTCDLWDSENIAFVRL